VSKTSQKLTDNDTINKVWYDLKDIIESFTGGYTLDAAQQKLWALLSATWQDEQASAWWSELRSYVNTFVDNPEAIKDESIRARGDELWQRGVAIFRSDKFENLWRDFVDESRDVMYRIRKDPTSVKLAEDTRKLAQDFMLDEKGSVSWLKMQHSISQMRELVMPLFAAQLINIPVPVIEGSTKKVDYKISNVRLADSNIIPEHVYLQVQELTDVNLRRLTVPMTFGYLLFQIRNLRINLKDVNFWFHRKTFPKIEDTGVANIELWGPDTSVAVRWRVQSREGEPFRFYTDAVQCYIQHLKIDTESKHHDFLLKMVTKLFKGTAKRDLESSIEDALRDMAVGISDRLNEVALQAHNKKQEIGTQLDHAASQVQSAMANLNVKAQQITDTVTKNIKETDWSGKAQQAKEWVQEKTQEAKGKASEVSERAGELAQQAKEKVQETKEWAQEKAQDVAEAVKPLPSTGTSETWTTTDTSFKTTSTSTTTGNLIDFDDDATPLLKSQSPSVNATRSDFSEGSFGGGQYGSFGTQRTTDTTKQTFKYGGDFTPSTYFSDDSTTGYGGESPSTQFSGASKEGTSDISMLKPESGLPYTEFNAFQGSGSSGDLTKPDSTFSGTRSTEKKDI